MDKIAIMINGLPGNVTQIITGHALEDDRFKVIPYSLTGPDINSSHCQVKDTAIELIRPENRNSAIESVLSQFPDLIAVDYTHPSAVVENASFYTAFNIPFVMGTTGGDRQTLEQIAESGQRPAVIAPNMAKQIVGFQAMMAYGAETFPNLFKGYSLTVKESHQKGKADTSGTAKAMVTYFQKMGLDFNVDNIEMERDPDVQRKAWQIPENHLAGHGWHTYTLSAPDGSALFEFKHNINGRDIYAAGTFDAVVFLKNKLSSPEPGSKVYSMIDVMTGG